MNFLATVRQEFSRIFQNKELRSLLLAAPFLYGFLLPGIYWNQRVKEMPLAVLDQDASILSREMIRKMDATEGVKVESSYADLESAKADLRNHEVEAILFVPRSFSEAFKEKKGAIAAIGVSSSNLAVASPILKSASQVAIAMSQEAFRENAMALGIHRSRASTLSQPLAVDIRPIYNPEMNQSDALVPGLLFVILQQVIIMSLCLIVTEDKATGRFDQSSLSWRSISAHIGAKILPYSLLNLAFSLIFFCYLMPFFKIETYFDKLPAYLLLCAAFAVAVSLIGFLFGLLFRDRVTVMIVLMFYSLPGFLASGFSWPTSALSWEVQAFGYLFPITHVIGTARQVILGPIGPWSYWHSILALCVYCIICFILSFLLLRRHLQKA